MVLLDERNFIETQLEAQGLQIFDFYQSPKTFDMLSFCSMDLTRRAEVLLVDTETILNHPELQEKFKVVLNTYYGVIFFHEAKNGKAARWIEDQASFLNKIIAEISIPASPLQWTMVTNQLQFMWSLLQEQKSLQEHLVKFSQELDQALQTAEIEMQKAKKIHEVLIPKRSEEIKGIHFLNKYAAGDGGGGEFYDLHQTGSKIYQILISSQSYLISSSLIGILNQHKQKEFNPSSFLTDSQNEILLINGSKKKKSEADVTIFEIDTTSLELKVIGPSKAEVLSLKSGNVQRIGTDSTYQLAKGEKLLILSSGFLFNWKEGQIKQDLYSFLNNHHKLSQTELMMELFLQLSSVKDSDFFKKDATAIMMEVNRHGIHQI